MADEELRRRERALRTSPDDAEARARLSAARARAGTTSMTLRTLEALERCARKHGDARARGCALAQVAWARARLEDVAGARALAEEAARELGDLQEGRQHRDLGLIGLARAGASLARAGEPARGRALLERAGAGLAALDEAWSDLGRLHGSVLSACGDAGLDSEELRRALPALQRSGRALVRGALPGPDQGIPALLAHLWRWGLQGDVVQAARDELERADASLFERARAVDRLLELEALDAPRAERYLEALERATTLGAPGNPVLGEARRREAQAALGEELQAGDPELQVLGPCLRAAGADPSARVSPWIEALAARGRLAAAFGLRLQLLRVQIAADDPALDDDGALLGTLLDEAQGLQARAPASGQGLIPGMLGARALRGLAGLIGAAEHLPARERQALLARLLGGHPRSADLARFEVLGAVAAAAERLEADGAPLLRAIADEAGSVLEGAGRSRVQDPHWLALEPLGRAIEAADALGDDALPWLRAVRARIEAYQARLERLRAPGRDTALFFCTGALYACAEAAWRLGDDAEAEAARRAALGALARLEGQDLLDAAEAAAWRLIGERDTEWRAEGLAALAETLAAHAIARGDLRGLVSPLTIIAAHLDPA